MFCVQVLSSRGLSGQRDQLAAQSFNLDQTAFATQSLQDTASTLAAMKAASGALKTQLSTVKVDDVYAMTDDMQELLDQNNDIQEALSRTYETPEVSDDDDVVFHCVDLIYVLFFSLGKKRDSTTTLWSRS